MVSLVSELAGADVALQIATSAMTAQKVGQNILFWRGCRDDTVPKTVDTRRHCEEE